MTQNDVANKKAMHEHSVLLEDLLKANNEEYLHDQIMELTGRAEDDGPPVVFGWKYAHEFVEVIQHVEAQGPAPPAPPPFQLPVPLNRENFIEALLAYVRVGGALAPMGTSALPCCSWAQFTQTMCNLERMQQDPWICHIIASARAAGVDTCLPLAIVYVPRPDTTMLDSAASPRPDSLWHA